MGRAARGDWYSIRVCYKIRVLAAEVLRGLRPRAAWPGRLGDGAGEDLPAAASLSCRGAWASRGQEAGGWLFSASMLEQPAALRCGALARAASERAALAEEASALGAAAGTRLRGLIS